MSEAEASETAELERAAQIQKRRRRIVVGSCLAALVLFCCVPCGLGIAGTYEHAQDLARFTPPPVPDPAAESEEGYRRLARARQGGDSTSCRAMIDRLEPELASATAEEVVAFHEWARGELARTDTQAMRSACQAVSAGRCDGSRFLAFRAYVLMMGRATQELAVRDPDALVDSLSESPLCPDLTWLSIQVLNARASDAGPAPTPPAPFDEASATRVFPRLELPRHVPRLCARYTCGPGDLLDF